MAADRDDFRAVGPLAEACARKPFANGTEGEAWMSVWCAYCVHDHAMHGEPDDQLGCDLILNSMMPDFPGRDFPWPEAWLPEPPGSFSLPSRMICGQFQPCTKDDCEGDPHTETRVAIRAEVTATWADISGSPQKHGEGFPCPSCGHRLSAYDWCPSCLAHLSGSQTQDPT